jgi:hypothetical protein
MTLVEVMLHAERFCLEVENALKDVGPNAEEDEELRLKIGQCRNILVLLQGYFDSDELDVENPGVRAQFRILVTGLFWVTFYGRRIMNYRLFRMISRIESTFTYLLVMRS